MSLAVEGARLLLLAAVLGVGFVVVGFGLVVVESGYLADAGGELVLVLGMIE